MAFQGWLADDEYADDEQRFIKVYFDFDNEEECRRFYNELFDNEKFDEVVNEMAFAAANGEERQ